MAGAAAVTEGQGQIAAFRTAICLVADALAAVAADDGEPILLRLRDRQDGFVVVAQAIAIGIDEHQPAMLPMHTVKAADLVDGGAGHHMLGAADGADPRLIDRHRQRAARRTVGY